MNEQSRAVSLSCVAIRTGMGVLDGLPMLLTVIFASLALFGELCKPLSCCNVQLVHLFLADFLMYKLDKVIR